MNESSTARPFIFAEFAGVLGGGALILTTLLTRRGQMIFLPYGILILAVALYLHSRSLTAFATRFNTILVSYMVATLMLFVYLDTVANPARLHDSPWRIIWPIGIFFLIGSAVSAIIAKLLPARPNLT